MIKRGVILILIILLILFQCLALDYELNYNKCGWKVLYTLITDVPLGLYLFYSLFRIPKLSTGNLSLQWMLYSASIALKFYFLSYPFKTIVPIEQLDKLSWAGYITKYHCQFAFTPLIYLLNHKLCIELSGISIWLYEMIHADLCISTTIDIWDVMTIAYIVPNITEYKHLMFTIVMLSIVFLGLVLPTTGVQVKGNATDWRKNSDIFIIAKFVYLVGLFLIDIPLLSYRIYKLTQRSFSLLLVKNFVFVFIRSFRLAIWQLGYRDAVKWCDLSKSAVEDKVKTEAEKIQHKIEMDIKPRGDRSLLESKLRRFNAKDKSPSFDISYSDSKEIDIGAFDLNVSISEFFRQFSLMCSHAFANCYERYISDDITISLFKRMRLVLAFNIQPIAHLTILLSIIFIEFSQLNILILSGVFSSLYFVCNFLTAPFLDVVYSTGYSYASLVSLAYSINAFWGVNRIEVRIFALLMFSFFPFFVIVPNIYTSIQALGNSPYACYKILIISCRWCIAPIGYHGVILGSDIFKNVILTDQMLQAHWTGLALLVILKFFCLLLSPDWIVYLVHISLCLVYIILSQAIRILQQRKYEIQYIETASHKEPRVLSTEEELRYIGRFGLLSCPGHLLPPIF